LEMLGRRKGKRRSSYTAGGGEIPSTIKGEGHSDAVGRDVYSESKRYSRGYLHKRGEKVFVKNWEGCPCPLNNLPVEKKNVVCNARKK